MTDIPAGSLPLDTSQSAPARDNHLGLFETGAGRRLLDSFSDPDRERAIESRLKKSGLDPHRLARSRSLTGISSRKGARPQPDNRRKTPQPDRRDRFAAVDASLSTDLLVDDFERDRVSDGAST